MKKIFKFRIVNLVFLSLLFISQSCLKDKCIETITYTAFRPIYGNPVEIRNGVKNIINQKLQNPGKIYLKDQYLFVNEVDKGIHVFDNSNATNPIKLSFINIPGNVDLAIRGNILYADSYIDLLAIDISDPMDIDILKRIEKVFPQKTITNALLVDDALGIVIGWEEEEITENIDCSVGGNGFFLSRNDADIAFSSVVGGNPQTVGVGGSLARFTIVDDFLYTIDNESMQLFNLTNGSNPSFSQRINIGFGIQTIFPYRDNLFIGSETGLFIYDNSVRNNPRFIGSFAHARNCDPVVVQDDRAYVTLRSRATVCFGALNQLDVIDISNLSRPTLITSYQMYNPHGLGIDGKTLFICDEADGLKVFDAEDDHQITNNLIKHFENVDAKDVIPLDGLLVMIGKDGLYQYDYSVPENMFLLSHIGFEE